LPEPAWLGVQSPQPQPNPFSWLIIRCTGNSPCLMVEHTPNPSRLARPLATGCCFLIGVGCDRSPTLQAGRSGRQHA
jgi:hypothetical protein